MLGQVLLPNTFYICEDSKTKAFSVFCKHFQPSNFIKTSPLKISHPANSLYLLLGNVYYWSHITFTIILRPKVLKLLTKISTNKFDLKLFYRTNSLYLLLSKVSFYIFKDYKNKKVFALKKISKTNLIKIKLVKLSYQTKSVYFFKVKFITKDILHFQQF